MSCWANARSALFLAQRLAGVVEDVVGGVEEGGHVGMHKQNMFQSTLPAWGATLARPGVDGRDLVSIHAPGEGSDVVIEVAALLPAMFQSTLPARGATVASSQLAVHVQVSIHAPGEGSDRFWH